jgi:hypothetical protein
MVNTPWASENVAILVPLTETLAPGSGLPFSSTTTPVIDIDPACPYENSTTRRIQTKKKKIRGNPGNFFVIQQVLISDKLIAKVSLQKNSTVMCCHAIMKKY